MRRLGQWLVMGAWTALAGILLWRILGLYQGPWEEFAGQTREFLRMASIQDSASLVSLGGSTEAIHQALETARQHPEQLVLNRRLEVMEGHQEGDSARIAFVYPACASNLLMVTFRGSGWKARIEDVSLPCGVP